MTGSARRPLPESLTRLLAERPPEPMLEEQFQTYLGERAAEADRWRVDHPSPPDRRTWIGFVVAMAALVVVIAALTRRMLA